MPFAYPRQAEDPSEEVVTHDTRVSIAEALPLINALTQRVMICAPALLHAIEIGDVPGNLSGVTLAGIAHAVAYFDKLHEIREYTRKHPEAGFLILGKLSAGAQKAMNRLTDPVRS